MSLKTVSVAAFALMVAGISWLAIHGQLFARHAWSAAIQLGALGLMVWARVTFGRRSFHASANPTSGGLVTSGPYAFLRHPIYAAAIYFTWAAVLDYRTPLTLVGAVLVMMGAGLRMYAEESLLVTTYPEYQAYKARTARVVPYLL
jgi:protein-S-isoprenylcysteine O-methyltransferase Ste14